MFFSPHFTETLGTYIRKRQGIQAVNDGGNENCSYTKNEVWHGEPIAAIYNRIKGDKTALETIGAAVTHTVWDWDRKGH